MLHNVFPSDKIPAPMAPQVLSAPPAKTFVLFDNPVRLASSGSKVPAKPWDSTRGGQISSGIPKRRQISGLHFFCATSKSKVPAASEKSVWISPVIRNRK